MNTIRAYLVLGRVSNLSTVWSNVICAWILSQGANPNHLALILLGTSLLYVAGMFMNDLFDADFDARYRPERPIPSNRLTRKDVRDATIAATVIGIALLLIVGLNTGLLGLLLVLAIYLYNRHHKGSRIAPFLMALCRALLFLVAAAENLPLSLPVLAAALSMFLYIAGVTLLASKESGPQSNRLPPLSIVLILLPIMGAFAWAGLNLSLPILLTLSALVIWIAFSFSRTRTPKGPILGKAIAPLLAGIPLLDATTVVAAAPSMQTAFLAFPICFAIALIAQRMVPAS